MIKKWNKFNENNSTKPGSKITGSKKISISSEEMSMFVDEPVLQKLILDDKVALLNNEVWYFEDDKDTLNVLDQYLELKNINEEIGNPYHPNPLPKSNKVVLIIEMSEGTPENLEKYFDCNSAESAIKDHLSSLNELDGVEITVRKY
jgi:hypothetical protein